MMSFDVCFAPGAHRGNSPYVLLFCAQVQTNKQINNKTRVNINNKHKLITEVLRKQNKLAIGVDLGIKI